MRRSRGRRTAGAADSRPARCDRRPRSARPARARRQASRAYRAQRRDIGHIAFIDETLQDILGRNRLPGDRRHGIRGRAKDDGDAPPRAPLGTGSSQSNLNWPFSGSQVDQTDSPTRMTEKCASCMRSRSTSSRSYGHCPGHSLTLPAVNFGICLASAFALPPSTKVSSRSSADTRWARIASSAPSGSCLAIASTTARCSFFVTE